MAIEAMDLPLQQTAESNLQSKQNGLTQMQTFGPSSSNLAMLSH